VVVSVYCMSIYESVGCCTTFAVDLRIAFSGVIEGFGLYTIASHGINLTIH
jgi:hypothetical protein